jgi:glycerophosphoryl diester phosphodiesterase
MVLIIGHRGARNLWPENSLEGFRRTRELGVDAVEFDVHLAKDGELVVIHDPSLDRTTEGTGPVADRTAAELAAMGVPSLGTVLDVYAETSIELHIEIKTDALGRPYHGLEKQLLDVMLRRSLQQQAIVTSFVPEILETVRWLSPDQRVLASVDRRSAEIFGGLPAALDRFVAIGNCMVAVEKGLLADSLELCLQRVGGDHLGAWAPNDADDIAEWLARPIRQITTDRPDIALKLRNNPTSP